MPDFKVTFKGDLGNLAQFQSAVQNSAVESGRQIENANKRIASSVGKIKGSLTADSGAGLFTTKEKTVIDAYNRSMIQSGQIIQRVIKDYDILEEKGKFRLQPIFDTAYTSAYSKALGNLDNYEKALTKIAAAEKKIARIRLDTRRQQLSVREEVARLNNSKAGSAAQLSALINNSPESIDLKRTEENLARVSKPGNAFVLPSDLDNDVNGAYKAGTIVERDFLEGKIKELRNTQNALGLKNTKELEADLAKAADLEKVLATPQGALLAPKVEDYTKRASSLRSTIETIGGDLKADIDRTEQSINGLRNREKLLESRGEKRAARARRREPGYRELEAAANEVPPIQKDLATVLAQSKELKKNLLASGLGGGTKFDSPEFQAALDKQGAGISRYTENLRTGVKTVQGSFRDLNTGMLKEFTVDLDQNNKVVGRWGGAFRGAGTFLKQTVRDFQKVVEWTVATTVVFGALATVVGQLKSINELNTSLTRLSITAQATTEETRNLFMQISAVAFETATPLKDLIKVSDDIALATRSANQSTEQWYASIVDLTRAVGIFTNLTGKDTVQSADLLSAAFKQLNIAPKDLVGILSKVTAVAGGQATAIADILQSIGGLAEAAKAAGFTVDEQIAAVQVLAQVTNKSSDEIATSFKNLFGSVGSVGATKILEEFGISVRNSAGEIKPFLEIYSLIDDALSKGIIPRGRLPDVLRGISGGPRRAPDAAAVLGNLDKIYEVVGKSQEASNEALIAQAKILDSNQSKIVQFQNAFDTAIFVRFGEAVKTITDQLTSFGITFFGLFNTVPTGLLTTILQLGLFAGGARLVGSVFKNITPSVASFKKGIDGISTSLKEVTNKQRAFVNLTKSPAGRNIYKVDANSAPIVYPPTGKTYNPGDQIPKRLVGNQFPVVAPTVKKPLFSRNQRIGGIVGGASAIAGLNIIQSNIDRGTFDAQQFGALLQTGGALLTLLPGVGTAVGLASIAVGTALQFVAGETDKTKKSSAELSGEMYTLIQNLQETQTKVGNYEDAQKEAGLVIDELRDKTNKTADEQLRLSDATTAFAVNTLALASANRQVSDTFDEILLKIPELADKYQQIIGLGKLDANSPILKILEQQLSKDILTQSGQGVYAGPRLPIADTFRPISKDDSTTAIGATRLGGSGVSYKEPIDLTDLSTEDLKKIFGLNLSKDDPNFGIGTSADIPRNEGSLASLTIAVQKAITDFNNNAEGALSEEALDALIKATIELSKSASSFTQNRNSLTQQQADIQAKILTQSLTPEQGNNAVLANSLATLLNKTTTDFVIPSDPYASPDRADTRPPNSALTRANELIKSLSAGADKGDIVTNDTLKRVGELGLLLNGTYDTLKEKGDQAFGKGVLEFLKAIQVDQKIIDSLAKEYNLTLSQTLALNEELVASMDEAKRNAAQVFGDRALKLRIAENSGDFEKNAAGLKILKEQNKQAYDSTVALIDKVGQLGQVEFTEFNNVLSETIGLTGLYITDVEASSLTAEQLSQKQAELASKLVEGAVAAGVNAEGLKLVEAEAFKLIAIMANIPPYKKVIIEIETLYNKPGKRPGYYVPPPLQNALDRAKDAEKEAIAAGTDPGTEIDKIMKEIDRIIDTGIGGKLGQLPDKGSGSKAPYNKPGLLDIPEEILAQPNYRDLIDKAIKNATNLQKKVPGETAENKKDIVELLDGTKNILETRGVGEEYLRRALDELTGEIKKQNDLLSKADKIRRIRVGTGSFAALANVPINSQSGVSVGGPQGPITVSLDVNGTVLTPAQFAQFADMVGASIKRQLAT